MVTWVAQDGIDHALQTEQDLVKGPANCLAAKDIPLRSISRNLFPLYISPFKVDKIISPTALKFSLSPTLRIQPLFRVPR